LEEFGNGKGKLANASEEGQGPRRAVEPMMMMIVHVYGVKLYLSTAALINEMNKYYRKDY
jgi:hypothetical protein